MWTYSCEWDMGIEGPWKSKDKMIADLREKHSYEFDGDPDVPDFDTCVKQGYYTFKEK